MSVLGKCLYIVCSPVILKIMYICKLYRDCIYVHKICCSFVKFLCPIKSFLETVFKVCFNFKCPQRKCELQ